MIVTRFAPSPTGFLHIGGARTALFNWLLARHSGGKFLLRIEDTDRARSTPEATQAIYEGLDWLGLDWDGDVVSQFDRIEEHQKAVAAMLENGTAYRCYSTREEIAAAKELAKTEKRPLQFQSPWRDKSPNDYPDAPYAVRLKTPRTGEVIVADQVQGAVTFKAVELDDMIILRSDGSPTYNLAVVVDDHDMEVTHIVRGDDHLTNAARQTLVYQALGWDIPIFAHIPLIHGADGAKLSKRHGALGVSAYRDMGYLPAGMRNYLARLGWSHGDDEFFTTEQMIEWFGLEAIGKSPARFDFKKLENLNGQHIRAATDEDLLCEMIALRGALDEPALTEKQIEGLRNAMPGLKPRAKTLLEMFELAYFVLADGKLILDEKAAKQFNADNIVLLSRLTKTLENVNNWHAEELEAVVREFAESEGLKLGKVAQPLRAALTGRAVSPGVFDVMCILGKTEVLARIADQI